MFKFKYNTVPIEEWMKKLSIYTNWYENDFEFKVTDLRAHEIEKAFKDWEMIYIVEDWVTYYINPKNIIAIEIY